MDCGVCGCENQPVIKIKIFKPLSVIVAVGKGLFQPYAGLWNGVNDIFVRCFCQTGIYT